MSKAYTYLNGTLHEAIYMQQPEGCEDGTGQVCKLVKPLCGLKQAGCEWNNEFDGKLKDYEYHEIHVFIFEETMATLVF